MHLLQNLGKDENSFKDVNDALVNLVRQLQKQG